MQTHRCPTCQSIVEPDARYCERGHPVVVPDDVTVPAGGGGAGPVHPGDGETVPAEGRRPDSSSTLQAGDKVWGRFRIQRELGRGGMGIVYLAWDEELTEPRAIKVLPASTAGNLAAIERFREEVRSAKKLKHPHIVKVDDIHSDGGLVGLSMEYVRGFTLQQHLDGLVPGSPFRTDDPGIRRALAHAVAAQIGDALDHVHDQELVHCDLKPSNILIGRAERDEGGAPVLDAQLADFGIARALGQARAGGGESAGTAAFMAPEVRAGGAPTAAADIYALGLVISAVLSATDDDQLPDTGGVMDPRIRQVLASCADPDPRRTSPQHSLHRWRKRQTEVRPSSRGPRGNPVASWAGPSSPASIWPRWCSGRSAWCWSSPPRPTPRCTHWWRFRGWLSSPAWSASAGSSSTRCSSGPSAGDSSSWARRC